MTSSLTIRPERTFPSGQVALLEMLVLCLPGAVFVLSLVAHQWMTSAVAILLLIGLVWREGLDWRHTAVTVLLGQIRISSPYGFRREIPVGEVDRMLRAGSNVYFLSKTGARLGAFPAGIFTRTQVECLANYLGVEVT